MRGIKKILFPLDFSEMCPGAGRYVEAFAGRFEAEIMLLHAVERGKYSTAEELQPRRQLMLDSFMRNELTQFTTHRICRLGEPADVIAETARTWCPDLVMMPTHGIGLYDRLILGSVTAQMLRELDCLLWTDVHSEFAPPLENIHCRRILCAVDLGERSRSVLQWADVFAAEYQAELTVVHAIPERLAVASGRGFGVEHGGLALADSQTQVEALVKSAGANASASIEYGDPPEIISLRAAAVAADLLVVGRHQGSGLQAELYQHLYSIVCKSPCPVLSI